MIKKLYFTKTHEWVKLDGNIATIGITDYAQNELGDIVFLEVTKEAGEHSDAKEVISTIESVKAVSDIYLPVSGNIIEINQSVINNPELINSNPFDEGWIVKVEPDDANDIGQLLDETAYMKHISEKG